MSLGQVRHRKGFISWVDCGQLTTEGKIESFSSSSERIRELKVVHVLYTVDLSSCHFCFFISFPLGHNNYQVIMQYYNESLDREKNLVGAVGVKARGN